MLTLTGTAIPSVLQTIADPPTCLYVRGDGLAALLAKPRLAIVGSRKVTPYGRHVTHALATELAQRGVVIVSGLALGVDSIAHTAALEAGGLTIAVLPGGVNRVYPRSHQQLAETIIARGGALISERPDDAALLPYSFIQRNRIVSGISDAVVVTEASAKSGTLHTATFATKQGRVVFAVPGPITSPQSAGTNALLQHGAQLVTCAEDIIVALGIQTAPQTATAPRADDSEQAIIELLRAGISDGGELLAKSALSAPHFAHVMTMLEIGGIVKQLGNNQWMIA